MNYKYCPQCSNPLMQRFIENRERHVCSQCDFIYYQHSKLCVGALVLDQGKLLLVKRAIAPFKGYWDIPGGFLEAGEAPQTGAMRELLEETGLLIQPTELLGLYMDTYGPTGEPVLTICYIAEVVGGEGQPQSDVEQLQWFELTALPKEIAFDWSLEALQQLQNRHDSADRSF